jgi:uncharacterized protein (DUF1697 family)
VVFESQATHVAELESRIEAKLQETLGYEVPTFIRTAAELLEVAKHQPFGDVSLEGGTTLYVSFLRSEPAEEQQRQMHSLSTEIDAFQIHKNHVFWLFRRPLGESGYTNADIEKTLQGPATRRNLNTVRKIAAKYFSTD